MKKDISILIVHYNTPGLLLQTLKGIFESLDDNSPLDVEVIVVDNNPKMRVRETILRKFPEVSVIVSERNLGFGGGMNKAMEHARGRYLFVFNPDIATFPGQIEKLARYMDSHPRVGIVAPKLVNPDRSLQYSCYTFMPKEVVAYRRVPILRSRGFAKHAVDRYLMADWDHKQTREVDYVLGASMLVKRQAVDEVGGFDPNFFVYFEDQDWCRRFWKAGWKVVYFPESEFVHYHRRETAEGGFIKQLRNPLTLIQLKSAMYYYKKYKGEENPRTHAQFQLPS
jgi:GT2 family glycosyltransferase